MTVAELQQLKAAKEQEIASLKQQLQHIKVEIPDLTDDDKDALEEQRLRAGAEAYMDYDPNTAYSWLQQAENLKAKRDIAKAKKESEENINSIDNIKQIAIQYRANMLQLMSPNWLKLDPSIRKQVENDIKKNRTQLMKTELGRALVSEVDAENNNTDIKDPSNDTDKTDKTDITNLDELINNAVDKTGPRGKPDGIADNAIAIESALEKLATKYPSDDPDVKALRSAWASMQNILSTNKTQESSEEEKQYSRGIELEDEVAKWGILQESYNNLSVNPSAVNKSQAITSILRKESGAAIANDEFVRRLGEMLPTDKFNDLQRELQSSGISIMAKILPDASVQARNAIALKYTPFMDVERLKAFLLSFPPARVKSVWKKNTAKMSGQPKREDFNTTSEYIEALRKFKEGK